MGKEIGTGPKIIEEREIKLSHPNEEQRFKV